MTLLLQVLDPSRQVQEEVSDVVCANATNPTSSQVQFAHSCYCHQPVLPFCCPIQHPPRLPPAPSFTSSSSPSDNCRCQSGFIIPTHIPGPWALAKCFTVPLGQGVLMEHVFCGHRSLLGLGPMLTEIHTANAHLRGISWCIWKVSEIFDFFHFSTLYHITEAYWLCRIYCSTFHFQIYFWPKYIVIFSQPALLNFYGYLCRCTALGNHKRTASIKVTMCAEEYIALVLKYA